MLRRQFESAVAKFRYLFLIPVVFLLLTALGSFVYGASIFFYSFTADIYRGRRTGDRLGSFLIILDTFLVGATLVVVAVGFYELFVVRRPRARENPLLPGWLRMRDLEDLKARVISMLILVSAITFTDVLVEQNSWQEDLFTGVGVAVIIAALTLFLRLGQDQARGGAGPGEGPDG